MQLKFLTLGFISAALFSNVVVANGHGSLVNAQNTDIEIDHVLVDILNNLDAHNLLKNLNLDVLSHVASEGGDRHDKRSVLSRRRLAKALARREWEADEDEADEDEADEDEADEDENEEDEEEEDEDEEDEDEEDEDENEADENEADENEADESSASKVARRSADATEEESTIDEEDAMAEVDTMAEEDIMDEGSAEDEDNSEEQDDETVMRMSRRGLPGVGGIIGGGSSSDASTQGSANDGGLTGKITRLAGSVTSGGL